MTPNPKVLKLSELLKAVINSSEPPDQTVVDEATELLADVTKELMATGGGEKDNMFDGPDLTSFLAALPAGTQFRMMQETLLMYTTIIRSLAELQNMKSGNPAVRMASMMRLASILAGPEGLGK